MWKTLLVPHDFSACADSALRVALELAETHGSDLVILHVSDLPPNVAADARITPAGETTSVRVDEYVTRGASARLEAIAGTLRKGGVGVCTRAVIGDVADEILKAAEDHAASAIVVGTHGRNGLAHLLLGSIAEKIVRRSRLPVVTVRTPAPEAQHTAEEVAAEDELSG